MKNMLIFGKAFEIAYVYKNKDGKQELRVKVSSPFNSIAYSNEEGEVEMFLYFYYKELEDDLYIDCVFKYVSSCKNITKFEVEEPSLNEIFIEKVGKPYEK